MVLFPFVALLMGASVQCGTAAGSSAGSYGVLGGPPSPSESVTVNDTALAVSVGYGDRMFTDIASSYDPKTLALISARRHASCCGSYWNSTVTRNPDGSYDIESQKSFPSRDGNDVYQERRPHLELAGDRPIVVGHSLAFVPWLRHATHADTMVQLDFDPIRVNVLSINDTDPKPFPANVPSTDKAVHVVDSERTTTLWYDPCTFTLDAYGVSSDSAFVRTARMYTSAELNPVRR